MEPMSRGLVRRISGEWTSGKGAASPPLPPLRTVRAAFTAHGSSNPYPPCCPDFYRSGCHLPLGVRLQAVRLHLTCPFAFVAFRPVCVGWPPGPRQPPF